MNVEVQLTVRIVADSISTGVQRVQEAIEKDRKINLAYVVSVDKAKEAKDR